MIVTLEETIRAFVTECETEYGMTVGICDNDPHMYHAELRASCEVNYCGGYGKNYACPPYVGSAEDCIRKAQEYRRVIVFQKVYPLEDSFDFEGMFEAQRQFSADQIAINERALAVFAHPLVLGAGGCRLCARCGVLDDLPCRHPEKVSPSLESYCIQVSELAALVGMKYINGANTVTYFGAVLLK